MKAVQIYFIPNDSSRRNIDKKIKEGEIKKSEKPKSYVPVMLASYGTRFKGNRFLFSTGEVARLQYFDSKNRNNLIRSKIPQKTRDKLNEYENRFLQLIAQGITDKKHLKNALEWFKKSDGQEDQILEEELQSRTSKDSKCVLEFGTYYLDNNPTYFNRRLKQRLPLRTVTISTKRQALKHLSDFEKVSNRKLTFQNADSLFWEEFDRYLKDFSPGQRGKIKKDLKNFFNIAVQRGMKVNNQYKISDHAKTEISEKKDHIYLTLEEIESIVTCDKIKAPHLIRSRDLLLVACGTGLRVSDIQRLKTEAKFIHLEGGAVDLMIKTQKTGKVVRIPLLYPWIIDLFKRYDWKFPKTISGQKLNENLKTIGELAELDRLVKIPDFEKGGTKQVPIKEIITSHIGRSSFITNGMRSGLTPEIMKNLAGHSKLETTMSYYRVTEEENARNARNLFKYKSHLKAV